MHQLPPELCSLICELACINDGRAGRSLALASRYTNEASKSCRLTSVSVIGAKEICGFAKMLNSMEKGEMGTGVLHLTIELKREHDWPFYHRLHQNLDPEPRPMTAARRRLPNILSKFRRSKASSSIAFTTPTLSPREERLKYEITVTDSFLRILTLTAPTLRSLNLTLLATTYQNSHTGGYHMPDFPSLQTLVPNYDDHNWCFLDDMIWPWRSVSSLQVLDLTGFVKYVMPGRQYTRIRRFAPSLRELRIPVWASHGLKEALGIDWRPVEEWDKRNMLPSTIQRVAILLERQVACRCYCNSQCDFCARWECSDLIKAARELASRDDRVRLEGPGWKERELCEEENEDMR